MRERALHVGMGPAEMPPASRHVSAAWPRVRAALCAQRPVSLDRLPSQSRRLPDRLSDQFAKRRVQTQALQRPTPRAQVYCAHEYTESNAKFTVFANPGNALLKQRQQQVQELRRKVGPSPTVELKRPSSPCSRAFYSLFAGCNPLFS